MKERKNVEYKRELSMSEKKVFLSRKRGPLQGGKKRLCLKERDPFEKKHL